MQRYVTAEPQISYLAHGPSDGRPVLCLHGFPDIPRGYEGLMKALGEQGFRVVAPWLPGYAPSAAQAGGYAPSLTSERLMEFIDALCPDGEVDVIGHDWGAQLVYELVGRHPERFRRAVAMAVPHPKALSENIPRFPVQLRRSWYMMFFQLPLISTRAVARRDFAFIDRLWSDWSPGHRPEPGYMAELKQCLAASMPAPVLYYRHALRDLSAQLRGEPTVLDRRIEVPTLYLHGENDGCIGKELGQGQESMYDAEFSQRIVAGAGHFLHVERPREVEALIVDWLTRS